MISRWFRNFSELLKQAGLFPERCFRAGAPCVSIHGFLMGTLLGYAAKPFVVSFSVLQVFRNRKRLRLVALSGVSGPLQACCTFARCRAPRQGTPVREGVIGVRSLFTSGHRIFVPAHFTTWKGELQIPSGGKNGVHI